MRQAILEAKDEQDSVGGAIECAVFGLPAGLGGPDFGENAEGIFSQYLFAVPAVKAVGFGAGDRKRVVWGESGGLGGRRSRGRQGLSCGG